MAEQVFTNSPRLQVLWRTAYAFLRLDQLPSGGWGKTLTAWMEEIWKGDYGSIPRNPQMRTVGGTDLTTYALYYYFLFLEKALPPNHVALQLRGSEVADRVYQNFKEKVNFEGAVGGRRGFGTAPDVRVRHTLMGLITFLMCGKTCHLNSDILDKVYQYLVEKMPEWRQDKSHLFAMVAAAIKLQEMLSQDIARKQLDEDQIEHLKAVLATYIPQMMNELSGPIEEYSPIPVLTTEGPLDATFFRPYYNFWRMERSSFLMNFPFLTTDDGQAFLAQVSTTVQARCAWIFSELLKEIEVPYNDSVPSRHLIRYHRDPENPNLGAVSTHRTGAPRDWGLSAEFAVLLNMKVVHELVIQHTGISGKDYDQKQGALNNALLNTFDHYHRNPEIFRFTHGSSFGRILHLVDKQDIRLQELTALDKAVDQLCFAGITEQGLLNLMVEHVCPGVENQSEIEYRALKNFLVAKLESGEYTPDGHVCPKGWWERRIQHIVDHSTIAFYDGDLGEKHVKRYEKNPELNLISELQHRFDWTNKRKRTALDVGCGPGQYAELLAKMGFEVTLLDASRKMLERASTRLGISSDHLLPINIFNANWGFPDLSFDLIFACAIMIHVPKERRSQVYTTFYHLLKPDGILFVNYKIGDHTLISEDGRFFAYYRDESWPMTELENHGFRIEAMVLNTKNRNMYQDYKLIRWVNLYCRKTE